jgi:hypothetical protein
MTIEQNPGVYGLPHSLAVSVGLKRSPSAIQ